MWGGCSAEEEFPTRPVLELLGARILHTAGPSRIRSFSSINTRVSCLCRDTITRISFLASSRSFRAFCNSRFHKNCFFFHSMPSSNEEEEEEPVICFPPKRLVAEADRTGPLPPPAPALDGRVAALVVEGEKAVAAAATPPAATPPEGGGGSDTDGDVDEDVAPSTPPPSSPPPRRACCAEAGRRFDSRFNNLFSCPVTFSCLPNSSSFSFST